MPPTRTQTNNLSHDSHLEAAVVIMALRYLECVEPLISSEKTIAAILSYWKRVVVQEGHSGITNT
jgi:hypothetical protein